MASAVEHDRREVIVPWALHMTMATHRLMPAPVEWLLISTGVRRS